MFKLPSGREVSDEFLSSFALSIIREYAVTGFAGYEEAKSLRAEYLRTMVHLVKPELSRPFGVEDVKAIMEIVAPTTLQFAHSLWEEYKRLNRELLKGKIWK